MDLNHRPHAYQDCEWGTVSGELRLPKPFRRRISPPFWPIPPHLAALRRTNGAHGLDAKLPLVFVDATASRPFGSGATTTSLLPTPVFPAPKDPSRCISRHLVRHWWDKAEALAELGARPGRGWHSLRRKFASELVDQPLKVLADLGGWKSTQTIVECYQRPHQERLKEALLARRQASNGSE